ncbi:hypothetical protein [Paracoccus albus]
MLVLVNRIGDMEVEGGVGRGAGIWHRL